MVSGTVAAGLTGGTSVPASSSIPTARGSPIHAISARPELSAIIAGRVPPGDILAALALPLGTRALPGSTSNQGVGLYDRTLGLSVPASEQKVIEFFRAQLPAEHWRILSEGSPSNGSGYQVVCQHPGSDGYEWELGITVMQETFAPPSTPSPPTSPSTQAGGPTSTSPSPYGSVGTTPFSLRLFQVSDEQ